MTTTKLAKETSAVVAGLKNLIADTYALMGQTHLAHWNVEGPAFFQLHEAFQKQYEELFEAVDEIAEHLRALGFLAPGGLGTLAKLSPIEEMAAEPAPAKDYVAHLIGGHEALVARCVELRNAAGESGDTETEDLAIGRIRSHEKTLWMLKS
ncbi:MAG: DNA starvation/stationary phase protection protein [Verrucomicrobiia bacterium]